MEVYLEDIHEAEANVVRSKNQFLKERGWQQQHFSFKQTILWKKNFNVERDKAPINVEAMTTDEAIDLEVSFGKTVHKDGFKVVVNG